MITSGLLAARCAGACPTNSRSSCASPAGSPVSVGQHAESQAAMKQAEALLESLGARA